MLRGTLFLLLLPVAAEAAEAAPTPRDESYAAALGVLGGLALVLGLILLLYAISKRGLRLLPGAKGGAIQVLETRHLGPKKSLCLVKVRDRELLLGVGADRIELLCRLDAQPSASFDDTLRSQMEETS